jgi:hypothetical protein
MNTWYFSFHNHNTTAMAKIVYNVDLQVFDHPSEESEEFMAAIKLLFDCLFKLLIEPPIFKLYPNKVYRDLKKGFTVSIQRS